VINYFTDASPKVPLQSYFIFLAPWSDATVTWQITSPNCTFQLNVIRNQMRALCVSLQNCWAFKKKTKCRKQPTIQWSREGSAKVERFPMKVQTWLESNLYEIPVIQLSELNCSTDRTCHRSCTWLTSFSVSNQCRRHSPFALIPNCIPPATHSMCHNGWLIDHTQISITHSSQSSNLPTVSISALHFFT